jgi:integrase/recombinase XerD
VTVSEAIQVFLDSRVGLVSSKTARINAGYLASLSRFFGPAHPLAEITLPDLRNWRKELVERDTKYGGAGRRKAQQAKLSPHTIHGHVRVIRQFFAWHLSEGVIAINPAARLEQIPLAHTVGTSRMMLDADFEKMLAASQGDAPERIRDRALLWFFRHTGARLGGAANLTMDALELDRLRATVIEKGRGGGKMRTVFFKVESASALREWLDLRAVLPLSTDRVFTTVPTDAGLGGGSALSEKSIYMALYRMAKRAGVKGRWNPHSQRHALAKRMLRNGANLAAVSKVLGHSGIRVTHDHYGEYEDGEAQDAHSRFA